MQGVKNLAEAWERIRGDLRSQVGAERFRRWLDCLIAVGFADGVLSIGTPNRFMLEWIEARYLDELTRAAAAIFGPKVRVALSISGALFRRGRAAVEPEEPDRPQANAAGTTARKALESFVAGAPNASAYRAILELVHDRAALFNPLVVVGSSGMGKSHLLRGLAEAYRATHRSSRVHYVTADDFSGSLRTALRQRKVKRFRAFYRSLDLWAIDDFQLLGGRRHTQDEFLHTFDALVNRGARVVVATVDHPSAIAGLEDRLRQRLLGGLLLRIREPDYRTRLWIIRRESERARHALSEEVMEFLARHVKRNVRELISAVTRLSAYAALEGRHVGVAEAENLLADHLEGQGRGEAPQRIVQLVCETYGIPLEDLVGAIRRRRVAQARKVAFYLLRTCAALSLREIGELMGGRRPPTVRSAVREVEGDLDRDAELAQRIQLLREALGGIGAEARPPRPVAGERGKGV